MVLPYQILLKMQSKKIVHNKSLNLVLDYVEPDKEELNKSLPRNIKIRYGRISNKG